MDSKPTHLLRFFRNTIYALECIERSELTLPRVSEFNDPFDPNLDLLTEFEENYDKFKDWINKNKPEHSEKFNHPSFQQKFYNYFKSLSRYAKETREVMFAACFCEVAPDKHPKDNLYMWAHYADGHRGVAIEFNHANLTRALPKGDKYELYQLIYPSQMPLLTYEEMFELILSSDNGEISEDATFFQKHQQIIRSKSDIWKIESEWRLALENPDTNLPYHRLPILSSSISAVFLGCQIQKDVRETLMTQIQKNHPRISVYEAKKMSRSFGLEFKKIQ